MNTDRNYLFNFLKRVNLDKYVELFINEAITASILVELSDSELKELADKT